MSNFIALEETKQSGAPVWVRREIGARFVGIIVKTEDRARKDRKTGETLLNTKGNPAQEKLVHVLCMSTSYPKAGGLENQVDIAEGDLVRLAFAKGALKSWIDAVNELPGVEGGPKAKQVTVGDVVLLTTTSGEVWNDEPRKLGEYTSQEQVVQHRMAGKAGQIAFRGETKIRRFKAEESAWVDRAAAAYHQLKQVVLEDSAGPFDNPSNNGPDLDF